MNHYALKVHRFLWGLKVPCTNFVSLLPEGEGGRRPDEGGLQQPLSPHPNPLPQGEGIETHLKDLD